MAQEGSRRSEGVRRRRPFVVAYNALHVRPGVYDGAATFSLNVVQRLPEVLPDARIVAYVAEGENRLEPRPNLELRPVGEGRVHAAGRLALETLWLTIDLRRIGASVLISPNESIPLRAPAPVVVVAQNLVYHRHGVGDAFVGRERRERLRSNLSARYYRRRMAEAYAKAAAVIAVSGHTADMLVEHSHLDRSKTVVVHEGSDSMFLGNAEVPETRQPRLLAVSTLAPYKNLEAAIDVLARLRPQRPELVLDIAGSDWRGFKAELEEHAASRGVGAAVKFLGLVEPAELAHLYARSLLLLHLSECESFGLPLVEAMRFGLPVVAADRSSLPEVAAGAAALVNPDDSDAVASTVEAVLAGGAAELVELGHARAGELTWRATAEGIAAVVGRVAPGS